MKSSQKIALTSLAMGIIAGAAVWHFFNFAAWWFILLVVLTVAGAVFGEALKLSAQESIVDSHSINAQPAKFEQCAACHNVLSAQAAFCPKCGHPTSAIAARAENPARTQSEFTRPMGAWKILALVVLAVIAVLVVITWVTNANDAAAQTAAAPEQSTADTAAGPAQQASSEAPAVAQDVADTASLTSSATAVAAPSASASSGDPATGIQAVWQKHIDPAQSLDAANTNNGSEMRFHTLNYMSMVCTDPRYAVRANLIASGMPVTSDPNYDAAWLQTEKVNKNCFTIAPNLAFHATNAIGVYAGELGAVWVIGVVAPDKTIVGYIPVDDIQFIPIPTL